MTTREEQVAGLRTVIDAAKTQLNELLKADDMELVTVEWSAEKGRCYDCNLPAAYRLPNITVADGEDFLLCSVDAAYHAAHGDEIEYLFEEDYEEGDGDD